MDAHMDETENQSNEFLEKEVETGADDVVSSGDDAETRLAEALAANEMLKEQILRKAAEFENFRRRTRDEQQALVKYGSEGLILELLSVLDDFDRSMKSGKEHPDFDSLYSGTELVRAKLLKVLEARGLRRLAAVGTAFDVDYHDALLQVPTSEVEAGTVLDEVEPGYMLHERVIRHAKVTVASAATE